MKRNLHLLLIDPQNDFCDLPNAYLAPGPKGEELVHPALPVAGAHADMLRLARLIDQGRHGLSGISVTLDSHHRIDIAHPTFWLDAAGAPVAPFTQITAAQLRAGQYVPRDAAALARATGYLDALEQAGRYNLIVWPVHCEIGSWGHNVHADVRAAYNRWEESTQNSVNMVVKGTNPWTEHYSAIQAEVPDSDDPATEINSSLIALLAQADQVYIAGEAGSHCVKATTEHIADNWDSATLGRLVLITDCMSPVPGFGQQQESFIGAMRARGLRTASAAEVAAELAANV